MADAAANTGKEPNAVEASLHTVSPCPVSDVRSSGRPNFDHLDFNDKTCQKMTEYITPHAERLSEALWRSGLLEEWGHCIVCGVDFPNNLASHIWGRAHSKRLRERLGWRSPGSPAELEQYTQYWGVRTGPQPCYCFNHVTGSQGFCPLPASLSHTGAASSAEPPPRPVPAAVEAVAVAPPAQSTPQVAPASPPSSLAGRGGYLDALNSIGQWKAFMEPAAKQLEEKLLQLTQQWDFTCAVCEKAMTRGAHDHVQSKNHWTNLWNRLGKGATVPRQMELASDWSAKWVQQFGVGPEQVYLFNHLTGEQMLQAAGQAPAAAALPVQTSSPAPSVASSPPAACPAPAAQGEGPPGASGQGETASEGQQSAAGRQSGAPPLRNGIDFASAMNSKQSWKSYMDGPASQLEVFLYDADPAAYDAKCIVCGTPRNGIKNHITSQNHWKQLWAKISGKLPAPTAAVDWSSPWVEKIATGRGLYLFNHLTGEQGLKEQLPQAPAPSAASLLATPAAAAAAPPASSPAPAPAPAGGPSASGAQSGKEPAGGPCGLDEWVWERMISRGAEDLQRALAELGFGNPGKPVMCNVCQTYVSDVAEHIRSPGHYGNLRHRMNFDRPQEDRLSTGPWVQQAFLAPSGESAQLAFNHLTGEVGRPKAEDAKAG